MAEGGEPDDGDVLRRELEALRLRVAELQRAAGRDEARDGASLAQREELLREAERVAHLGTWTWEVASDRATWSDEMYRILGLRPGSIQPSVAAFYAAVHPEDLERVHAHKDQSVRDGMLPLIDCRIVRPDGSIRHTTVSSSVLFDGAGAVRAVVGGIHDRTESLEAEARLRRTLSLLEEAQACAQLGSWRYVPATGELEWSTELYRILGISPDTQPTPERFFECIVPEDRERFRANHEAPARNERGGEIDGRVQRPDGQVRHVRMRAFPGSGPGGVHELRGTMLDVTDQVRMREELAHAQKMEAVGRLAGGIAHDFNNLLTVITGNLELLACRIGQPAELEHSFQALNSAASLTRRLLAFGRKAQLSLKQVSPNELVCSTIALMHRLVGDEVRLEIALGDGLPMIHVDPLEIERALVNLVANARDAMPGGGVVRIGTQARRVAGHLQVELSVADRGRGIDEAARPHLFEPFFTTRAQAGGTGLGLATVLGTAEQHGGTVRVEAREGGGSIFTIVLPAADSKAGGQVLAVDSVHPHVAARPLRILVLDDEQAVANVTRLILEAHGHTVQSVSHPAEALRIWAKQHESIDLVICDIVMAHMRGPELVARLSDAGGSPRVLFITGYSEEAVRAGLRHPVLAKPFTAAALLRAIAEVVAPP